MYLEVGGIECGGNLKSGTAELGGETFCRIESSTGWGEVEAVASVDMMRWGSNWNGLAVLILSIGRTDSRIDMSRKRLGRHEMIGRLNPAVSNTAEFSHQIFTFADLDMSDKIQTTTPHFISEVNI